MEFGSCFHACCFFSGVCCGCCRRGGNVCAREAEEMAKIDAVFSDPQYILEREMKREPISN